MDCLTINAFSVDQAAVGLSGSISSKMDDDAARADACREYQSSLEDLTFNSKPHINMLTILAEENINFAKDIVAIIEAQISKVFINIAFLISDYVCQHILLFRHMLPPVSSSPNMASRVNATSP